MSAAKVILLSFIVSTFSFFLLSQLLGPKTAAAKNETVIEAVLKSKKIKCGYYPSPMFLEVNPITKEVSGLIYDVVEQVAKNLKLEIEWTEEVGVGDFIPALEARRFDAYCTTLYMNAERSKAVDFTDPILYDTFDIYARISDNRFDANPNTLNSSGVRIVTLEGDIFSKIVRNMFPNAKLIELPQISSQTDPLLYVSTNKADVVISTPKISGRFIENNPNKIKKVDYKAPLRTAYITIPVKRGELEFRRMLDIALMEMQANGQLDKIIDKYDPERKTFFRRAKPY